jgi:ACS family tartrate transporter-like MFS transporter
MPHPGSAGDVEAMATRKATLRLIPFLFLLYVVAYLDRVNIGFAALEMNLDLGFSGRVYGLGAGIFFIAYAIFEVPSNLIMVRVGPRRWIARIMITWGIISAGMMLVSGPRSFYALRFLLGAAEAGFLPGVIFYLTSWFPARHWAKTVALFMTGVAIAGVVGGPISGLLLGLHGLWGLHGWQVLFLAEGIPAVLLGLVTLFYLPDGPGEARWLTPAERSALASALEEERRGKSERREYSVAQALTSGRVWILCGVYFGIVTSLYGVAFWLPTIIEEFSRQSNARVGFLSAIPYVAAAIGMVAFAWNSDRTGERRGHVAACTALAAVGLALTGLVGSSAPAQMAALTLAALGIFSSLGTFWTLPPAFLSGRAAAAGIALINSVGNVGGFVGPFAVGYIRDRSGSNYGAMLFLAALVALGGALALLVRHDGPALAATRAAIPTPSV